MGKKTNDIYSPRKKGKDKTINHKKKFGSYSSKHIRERERTKSNSSTKMSNKEQIYLEI